MNRRAFFGAAAGAAVAAPAIAAEVAAPKAMESLSLMIDAAPFEQALHGYAGIVGKARAIQFNDRPSDRYVYRTGYPGIDALRSISGVHKALMEKQMDASA